MIKGMLILRGRLKLLSPAIIGSGRDDNSDMDVLRDGAGLPYIPATSFVGVLRHMIKLDGMDFGAKLERFWGFSDENPKNAMQSSIIVSDLEAKRGVITKIRDGVKISNAKGVAEEGAKFDYEIIERDSEFELSVEVSLDGNDDDFRKRMLATIVALLKEEKVQVGAKTNSGFGRIKLIDYQIYAFDFSKKEDVFLWFSQDRWIPKELEVSPFDLVSKTFTINADFFIKGSLIVRTYNYEPNKPDVEHIKSNDKPVLPGTSIKGAIRARAERIIKTLGKPESIITDLFGDVDIEGKRAKKGRVTVEETILEGYSEEVQTRIKIDRFTGGVIEGALFEASPLFRTNGSRVFNIKICVNSYQEHEAGLMLLILKDLWTGDLPIGGEKAIGRGILEGKGAIIKFADKTIEFDDISKLEPKDKDCLQGFVKALVNLSQ